MGYWGWRPLICGVFISTWVVGCNIVNDHTPSAAPSAYPDITLTVGRLPTAQVSSAPTRGAPTALASPQPIVHVSPTPTRYVIQPGDTLERIAEHFQLSVETLRRANADVTTLTPGDSLSIPTPAPLLLNVHPPTCYEISSGNLLCLGRVDNPLDFSVENVSIQVSLLQEDGAIYQTEQATVEQTIILAGGFAPYQAAFRVNPNAFSRAEAGLRSAARGTDDAVAMLIQDVQGEMQDGRVIVSAVIYNAGREHAEILRVFVTLLDGVDRVIGYRVLTFERQVILDAGENFPVRVELTPQVSDVTPDYAVYVEARTLP